MELYSRTKNISHRPPSNNGRRIRSNGPIERPYSERQTNDGLLERSRRTTLVNDCLCASFAPE
jgi:hypothetical protein